MSQFPSASVSALTGEARMNRYYGNGPISGSNANAGAMPPVAGAPAFNRSLYEENLHKQINDNSNAAFNKWYGSQKPESLSQFAPQPGKQTQLKVSGSAGTFEEANHQMNATEAAAIQRENARSHFTTTVLPGDAVHQQLNQQLNVGRMAGAMGVTPSQYTGGNAVPPIPGSGAVAGGEGSGTPGLAPGAIDWNAPLPVHNNINGQQISWDGPPIPTAPPATSGYATPPMYTPAATTVNPATATAALNAAKAGQVRQATANAAAATQPGGTQYETAQEAAARAQTEKQKAANLAAATQPGGKDATQAQKNTAEAAKAAQPPKPPTTKPEPVGSAHSDFKADVKKFEDQYPSYNREAHMKDYPDANAPGKYGNPKEGAPASVHSGQLQISSNGLYVHPDYPNVFYQMNPDGSASKVKQ